MQLENYFYMDGIDSILSLRKRNLLEDLFYLLYKDYGKEVYSFFEKVKEENIPFVYSAYLKGDSPIPLEYYLYPFEKIKGEIFKFPIEDFLIERLTREKVNILNSNQYDYPLGLRAFLIILGVDESDIKIHNNHVILDDITINFHVTEDYIKITS